MLVLEPSGISHLTVLASSSPLDVPSLLERRRASEGLTCSLARGPSPFF